MVDVDIVVVLLVVVIVIDDVGSEGGNGPGVGSKTGMLDFPVVVELEGVVADVVKDEEDSDSVDKL